jgi:hypothetical protein
VQYAFYHDDWVIHNTEILRGFIGGVFARQESIIKAISKTLEESVSTASQKEIKRLNELKALFIPQLAWGWRLLIAPEVQLRFIKSFCEEDFGTIYCERAWRMIYKQYLSKPMRELLTGREDRLLMRKVNALLMGKADGFKFKPQDVCFIVCPGRYVKELVLKIRDHDDFRKYFGIPVVAFEDLLEH